MRRIAIICFCAALAAYGQIPRTTVSAGGGALSSTPTQCPAGSYPLGIDVNGNAQNCTTVPPPPTPGYTPNTLLSGGGVNWIGGLSFDVAAATYIVGNTQYTSSLAALTLGVADATNPRIDLIVVNSSGAAAVVAGTPAATPSAPVADPTTQLGLTTILVPANSSTPGNITSLLVYDEDTGPASEWTTTSSGSGWALASTNNPYHGTKDIEATSVAANAYVNFAKAAPITLATYNYLVAYIRSKASWAGTKSLQFQLYLSGNKVGNAVSLYSGSLGFSSSSTTSYQLLSIPVGLFGASVTTADTVRVTVAGGGAAIGFYLDYLQFQGGTAAQAGNYVTWRGPWNSSAAYNVNDAVSSSNALYVALVANTNSTPSPSNANWAQMSTAGGTLAPLCVPASASGTTYTCTGTWTSYANGSLLEFKPDVNNTGAATVNVNSIGAAAIVDSTGAAVQANALVAGTYYILMYDGTSFRVGGTQGVPGGNAGNWFAMAPPDFSTATWTNQNTASYATVGGLPVITAPYQSTNQQNDLLWAVPGATYTVTLIFSVSAPVSSGNFSTAIMVTDSAKTKAITVNVSWASAPGVMYVTEEPSAGVIGAEIVVVSSLALTPCQVRGLRIVEDASKRTYYYSCDGGTAWAQVYQENAGTYITPAYYGIAVHSNAATAANVYTTVYNLGATTP